MLTQEMLKNNLHYDPATGIFTRLTSCSNRVKVGDVAGSLRRDGYTCITVNKKSYQTHRLAWLYVYGELPTDDIDHINQIKNDNRISNLRYVSHAENLKNASRRNDNTSGFTGVCWDKAICKWRAQIRINRKLVHLGMFNDKFEAICARMSANSKYGFHENHGRT